MRFFSALSTLLPAIVAVSASPALQGRADVLNSIVAPADGTVIQPGETFSFQYTLDNWCEDGYTPVSVYLLQTAPTSSSLNSTGKYSQFVYHFGDYLYNNFGLPVMSPGPPPSTLTMPTLDSSFVGQTIYFATAQTENGCPVRY
ncbi:hypothetical protein BC835DRAFT_1270752 [Cytidiella melzeri]|nr:hypothetical protein BC835DRAFT_1270752 [Cytidiella melzeri]